jgi:photoactive yellow protein
MGPNGRSMEKELLWRLVDLSPAQLDALPIGAIVIDFEGKVLTYNSYEAGLARLDARRVVGQNFFRDIAPCTAVKEFEGRMRAFIRSPEKVSESFAYFFPFAHGPVDVTITFLKMPDRGSLLIAIERLN